MSDKPTIERVKRIIRRRIGISKRAAIIAAKGRDARMMDYHAGCIGIALCILDDLGAFAKRKRKVTR